MTPTGQRQTELRALAALFLKLGTIAFGGPAAHIAMMEEEVVVRRKWLDRRHFLDLVGATNLIPGPNSTEMTMHVGYERAGVRGLLVAGACFILPAVTITALLAWVYVRTARIPAAEPLLAAIQPAVIGIIAGALWRLGRQAIRGWRTGAVGLAVVLAALAGVDEVLALVAAAAIGTLLLFPVAAGGSTALMPFLLTAQDAAQPTTGGAISLWRLALFFLEVGAVLYGSGYVLIAFLEGGLVDDLGWLSRTQLLDAVAIGQFTPGPVLSTATFIGFVLAGVPGAIVATVAIFLPSFAFVLLLNPLIPRLRDRRGTAAFLDAVNAAAVGLMLAVTLRLGAAVLTSWLSIALAAGALVLSIAFRINAAWIVLGAAMIGAATLLL